MRRRAGAGLLAVGAGLVAAPAGADAACPDRAPQYLALEAVRERLDLRGESRAQYLDRRYGAGRWRSGDARRVLIEPPGDDGRLTLRVAPGAGVERADLIVEARLEVITAQDRRTRVYGHRDLAGYPLAGDAQATINVPLSVFQAPGALVIALHVGAEAPAAAIEVVEWRHDARACEAPFYTEDRATAIRLNRRAGP
ncbi:MAG TPA: hypothetical protein VGA00_04545 [Acidiferrobacterales bacterium]